MTEEKKKLAEQIASYSIDVQKGDKVLITTKT